MQYTSNFPPKMNTHILLDQVFWSKKIFHEEKDNSKTTMSLTPIRTKNNTPKINYILLMK